MIPVHTAAQRAIERMVDEMVERLDAMPDDDPERTPLTRRIQAIERHLIEERT